MCDNESWARDEFEGCDLGDKRLSKRVAAVAAGMLNKPAQGIPAQLETHGGAKAAYRLLDNDAVDRESLQMPHALATLGRAVCEDGPVLFLQDTSTISFNTHRATTGLGPVNTKDTPGHGLLTHNCLAVTTTGEILGLANQQCWVRPPDTVRKKVETRTQRAARDDKESSVWLDNLTGLGAVPEGATWVSVGDRGSDIWEYWFEATKLGWQCLSRVHINRKLSNEPDETATYLMAAIRQAPACTQFTLHERARPEHEARTLTLSVAWTNVEVRAPRKRLDLLKEDPLKLAVVRCWDAAHKVEWLLVSTTPVTSSEQAQKLVDWYAMRWTIEEYHKCLKTGMGLEKSQLQTASRIENLLGILAVLAVRLLQLVREARTTPNGLALSRISKDHVEVLCRRRKLQPETLTVDQFYRGVAGLGGFLGRKGDGNPGWQTLWKGFLFLETLVAGYRLA
jgi:hypothetical protein